MNRFHTLPIVLTLVAFSTNASAQFVKGNEAVRTSTTGERLVELAPLPSSGPIRKTKPCLTQAGCHAGPWHMVETQDGLMECTEVESGETRYVICAVDRDADAFVMIPFGHLAPGNPFEAYVPPA